MPRFMTITCLLFHAWSTGMPAMAEPGSSAIGFTVSFAPMTSVTSVSGKSSLISSISSTTDEVIFSKKKQAPMRTGRTIVGHRSLRQKDVALPRHPSGDGMDGESNVDLIGAQVSNDIRNRVLCFGHCHTVADNLERR